MPSHADKTPENKGKAVASKPAGKKGGSEAISQFVDNRPEAQQRDRIQGMMNNSPQSRKAAQLQAMINQSPRTVAQRQQIDRMFGPAAQLQGGPEEEELQMKSETTAPVQRKEMDDDEMDDDDKPLQGKFTTSEAPTQLQGEPGLQKNKTGLPDNVKSGVENLSGVSLDNVNVHYNSAKPAQLNALAYTQGTDIHVGPGQEQHLPHEAWHVVQQNQGRVKPTMQMVGTQINDDVRLEHEADAMGAKALQLRLSNALLVSNHRVPTNKITNGDDSYRDPAIAQKSNKPMQFLLNQAHDPQAVRWDTICGDIAAWRNGRVETLENWITAGELAWNAQARQVNWKTNKVQSLKNVIFSAANADELPIADSAGLAWGGIAGYLQGLALLNLVNVVVTLNTPLGGGHGNGTYWSATNASTGAVIQTGSIPNNTHGLGQGALNGARGSVRDVIVGHNTILAALKVTVGAR